MLKIHILIDADAFDVESDTLELPAVLPVLAEWYAQRNPHTEKLLELTAQLTQSTAALAAAQHATAPNP